MLSSQKSLIDYNLPSNIRTVHCQMCDKNINAENLELHQLRCGKSKLKSMKSAISKIKQSRQRTKVNFYQQQKKSLQKQTQENDAPVNIPEYIKSRIKYKQSQQSNKKLSNFQKDKSLNLSEKRIAYSQFKQNLNSKIKEKNGIDLIQMCKQQQKKIQQKQYSNKKISQIRQQLQEEKVQCPLCGGLQKLTEIDSHQNQCPAYYVKCSHCHEGYPQEIIEEHYQICKQKQGSKMRKQEQQQNQIKQGQYVSMLYQGKRQSISSDKNSKQSLSERIEESQQSQQEQFFDFPESQSDYEQRNQFDDIQFSSEIRRLAEQSSVKKKGLTQSQINNILVSEFNMRKIQEQKESKSKYISKSKLKVKQEKQQQKACPICYVTFLERDKVIWTRCTHCFHQECAKHWLRINSCCPLCKLGMLEQSQSFME